MTSALELFCCLIGSCLISNTLSAPSDKKYCVEQTKNRKLVGLEHYAQDSAKDVRQCIARCIRDARSAATLCKSVVYSEFTKSCLRYSARAGEHTGLDLVRVQDDESVSYYELLTKCPDQGSLGALVDKRRDPGEEVRSESRPFAEKQADDSQPPGFAPIPGFQVDPSLQQVQPPIAPSPNLGGPTGGYGMGPAIPPPANRYGGNIAQPPPVQQPCCGQAQIIIQPPTQQSACCPAPLPQPCCPAPQPQPQPCCTPPPPPPQWGPWSAWSECKQVPCTPMGESAQSVQVRTRQCQGYGSCAGDAEQRQNCGCLQGQWTEWSQPAPCSVTCGSGTQARSRTCTVPGTCPGPDKDQQPCTAAPCCKWTEWAPPDACPVTCGQGSTVRRRQCVDESTNRPITGCQGPDVQPQPCNQLPPCCSPWSQWSQCSSTCGQSVQTRSKTCEGGVGSSTEQQACPSQPPCCSQWSNWSPCQVVCGQGYQTRSRSCGGSGGPTYGGVGLGMGAPTLPVSSGGSAGGCCNTQQQQPCQVGCSQNTFYGQSAQPQNWGYRGSFKRARRSFLASESHQSVNRNATSHESSLN